MHNLELTKIRALELTKMLNENNFWKNKKKFEIGFYFRIKKSLGILENDDCKFNCIISFFNCSISKIPSL